MSVPVGLTIPKLLPITGTFALPLSAYYIFLQSRVIYHRIQTEKNIQQESSSSSSSDNEYDPLRAAIRAQANFNENVPLALALAAVVELNGGSRRVLSWALGSLVVFRVLHADVGLMARDYTGPGRPIGYFGTQGFIAGMAGYAGWLVKGYWGF
ncbi:hypothetical protein PMZ80_007688 [Knufia obscura]|uniref:Uncharacterized protein n=1 Tax=Knufia obscura TaxID=1635080 RepID=A0ABR0RJB3_9EURO|nr:hypothetical protein PMZ80_007688 [Knufia obscura]